MSVVVPFALPDRPDIDPLRPLQIFQLTERDLDRGERMITLREWSGWVDRLPTEEAMRVLARRAGKWRAECVECPGETEAQKQLIAYAKRRGEPGQFVIFNLEGRAS